MIKNLLNRKKGITLVALVVTIVILLILAGISINLTIGQNGIIAKAVSAKEANDKASAEEKVSMIIGEFNIRRETLNKSLGDFLDEKKSNGEIDDFTDDGDGTFIITVNDIDVLYSNSSRPGIKVGDYINYQPDINTDSMDLSIYHAGVDLSYSPTANQKQLKWQVLKINEDGSIKLIGSIANYIYFGFLEGYCNGVYMLNDVCNNLYSKKSSGIVARSVNVDDFNECLTKSKIESITNYSNYSGGPKFGHTQTYVNTHLEYPPIFKDEKGINVDSGKSEITDGIDIESGMSTGLGQSEQDKIYTDSYERDASKSITVTQTGFDRINVTYENFRNACKALEFSGSNFSYVLASRFVDCEDDRANFGLFSCDGEGLIPDRYSSTCGGGNSTKRYIRPVVTLNSNVEITQSNTAGNIDGEPHVITKY